MIVGTTHAEIKTIGLILAKEVILADILLPGM